MYKVERRGKQKITTITCEHSESVFHDVDNLNTKKIGEAEDNYEKVFITVRGLLATNEQHGLDDETSRLALAQEITDILRSARLIRKSQS